MESFCPRSNFDFVLPNRKNPKVTITLKTSSPSNSYFQPPTHENCMFNQRGHVFLSPAVSFLICPANLNIRRQLTRKSES